MTSFEEYVATAQAGRATFGHREHLHVAWLAVRRHPLEEAIPLVCDGIRQLATYQKVPQKYHHTVSVAWLRLVAHHADEADDFDQLVAREPALLDKRLVMRHYSSTRLATPAAKSGWVEPDVAPLPEARP
jgi:hypothetical protein